MNQGAQIPIGEPAEAGDGTGGRRRRASNRREQISWYFYDWANSAFYTTVITVFLGPYLTSIAHAAADSSGFVYPLGIKVAAGSLFPYAVSASVLLQVAFLPIFGAIADYSRLKKQMFGLFAYIGALSTMGLYFLEGRRYLAGAGLFIIANLCFGASEAFYNSFLPEIALPDERDHVSSMGWATGYIGGGLLLALNLVLFAKAKSFGLTEGQAVRISLCSAGTWWGIFTLIPLAGLRKREPAKSLPEGRTYLTIGFSQLRQTALRARRYPFTLLFLVAYLIYNDGIQTVITMSSEFGQEQLGLSMSTLTTVVLMVQFVAFFGNILFDRLARMIGAKRAVLLSLVIWSGTLGYVYWFLRGEIGFYVLGAVIAVVLGGSQALSRSLYSQMIPRGQEAEYFSLYEVSDKGTSWLGPLVFGLALQVTGNYRVAVLSLVVFFIVGLIVLAIVDVRKASIEARHEAPTAA